MHHNTHSFIVIVPTLCFGEASQAIAEDEGSIMFTLTLSMPLLMDINITVITTDGTATGMLVYM